MIRIIVRTRERYLPKQRTDNGFPVFSDAGKWCNIARAHGIKCVHMPFTVCTFCPLFVRVGKFPASLFVEIYCFRISLIKHKASLICSRYLFSECLTTILESKPEFRSVIFFLFRFN